MTYDMGRICDIMQGIQRATVKVIILVPLAVFAAFFAIGPVGLVSYSPATRVLVANYRAMLLAIIVRMRPTAQIEFIMSQVNTSSPATPATMYTHTMVRIKLISPKPAAIAITNFPILT